jgi:5-methylcytosine-specific restriction endonuclease McrA
MALSSDWSRDVHLRDEFRCVYCDFDMSTFEGWEFIQTDHFKPRSRGGTDDVDNLKTTCMRCNSIKGGGEFSNLKEAKAKPAEWRESDRAEWEQKVKPLVLEMKHRK